MEPLMSVIIFLGVIIIFLFLVNFNLQGQLHQVKETAGLAYVDALTNLANRHAYHKAMQRQFDQLPSTKDDNRKGILRNGLGLLVIDIDKFKNINDNYGHEVGDMVLKSIATTLQENLRSGDEVFRYGGEEFVVLLPGIDAGDMCDVAEKLRESVAKLQHVMLGGRIVTVSVGASYCRTQNDFDNLFKAADGAMYRAKAVGGNQVFTSERLRLVI